MIKKLLITWGIAALLIWGLLWFGCSDLRQPDYMDEYIARNPMRPLFRAAFGWIMSSLVLISAIYITRSTFYRTQD